MLESSRLDGCHDGGQHKPDHHSGASPRTTGYSGTDIPVANDDLLTTFNRREHLPAQATLDLGDLVQDMSVIRCFAAAVTQATAFACVFAEDQEYLTTFGFDDDRVRYHADMISRLCFVCAATCGTPSVIQQCHNVKTCGAGCNNTILFGECGVAAHPTHPGMGVQAQGGRTTNPESPFCHGDRVFSDCRRRPRHGWCP